MDKYKHNNIKAINHTIIVFERKKEKYNKHQTFDSTRIMTQSCELKILKIFKIHTLSS